MNHKTVHIAMGLGGVLIFLASGVYMKMHFPDMYAANESIRYQFRANHIYILMSALVNLVAGLSIRPVYAGWRIAVSWVSTALLLFTPLLMVAAFFIEPAHGIAARPLTFYGVLALVVGVVLAYLPRIRYLSSE